MYRRLMRLGEDGRCWRKADAEEKRQLVRLTNRNGN
jgi:hypothetical protein